MMIQQTYIVSEGADCDSQVLNRPWNNVRYTRSFRLPEIIFKTTRKQIEPRNACSQQGGCQPAFKLK